MDIETAAQVMGMKPHREVQEVVDVDGGTAARTHDGQWTLVRDDGTTSPMAGPPVPAAPEAADDAEVVDDGPTVADVPGGSAEDVLAWVGEDPAYAAVALEAERGRDKPRTTVIAALEKVLG